MYSKIDPRRRQASTGALCCNLSIINFFGQFTWTVELKEAFEAQIRQQAGRALEGNMPKWLVRKRSKNCSLRASKLLASRSRSSYDVVAPFTQDWHTKADAVSLSHSPSSPKIEKSSEARSRAKYLSHHSVSWNDETNILNSDSHLKLFNVYYFVKFNRFVVPIVPNTVRFDR